MGANRKEGVESEHDVMTQEPIRNLRAINWWITAISDASNER